MASRMWGTAISREESRSAIVRASLMILWYERAERSRVLADLFKISFTGSEIIMVVPISRAFISELVLIVLPAFLNRKF